MSPLIPPDRKADIQTATWQECSISILPPGKKAGGQHQCHLAERHQVKTAATWKEGNMSTLMLPGKNAEVHTATWQDGSNTILTPGSKAEGPFRCHLAGRQQVDTAVTWKEGSRSTLLPPGRKAGAQTATWQEGSR